MSATYGFHQHQSISCPNSITGHAGVFFLALINTLFTNQCQLGNTNDYPDDVGLSLIDNETFDYIIVGGGTAGSVVAGNLAKLNNQSKILLLEAGSYPSPTSDIPAFHLSLQRTTEDWQFHTEQSNNSCLSFKNGRCFVPAGRVLGGSSTINPMLYIRGNKHIYNKWAESGNLGWSYHDISQYFKMSEKLDVDDKGFLPLNKIKEENQQIRNIVLNSTIHLGYKQNNQEENNFIEAFQYIQDGTRKNVAKQFLADDINRPNFKIAVEALVEKILIDKETREANGVQVNIRGRTLQLYAEKETIISAGTINSPKLLMLSGIGPKEHLGSLGIETLVNKNVGENLHDNIRFPLFVKINVTSNVNPTEELHKYFANKKGLLANTGIANIIGLLNTQKNKGDTNNIKLSYSFIPKQDSYTISQIKKNFNFNDDIIASLAESNKMSNILIIYVTLIGSKSKGKLLLKSKNPHEKPLIYPNYLSDKKDLDTMLKGIRIAEKQTETSTFKNFKSEIINIDIPNCRKYPFRSDEYWICAIKNIATTGYSMVGTCKMGLSIDPYAVVDPLLKVHGIENLRVIDASIIPSNDLPDLTATTIMIGQKGANLIVNGFNIEQDE